MSNSTAAPVSVTKDTVGGIPIQLYGIDQLPQDTSRNGLTVLFFLHGRFGSAQEPKMVRWCTKLIESSREHRQAAGGQGRHLVVVTFDQRNHGERQVDPQRNKGFKDNTKDPSSTHRDNDLHVPDMLSIQTGTARDVSFLIDFLPSSGVFAQEQHTITDWFVAGVSLGGHATWLTLAHDPRLTLGIPIIGSPNMLALLSNRAKSLPPPWGPVPMTAPFFPRSILDLIARIDPVNVNPVAWTGKKICVLSGRDDTLVPYDLGGTAEFVDTVLQNRQPGVGVGDHGIVQVFVQDGIGHAFSDEMLDKACEFLWKYGLETSVSNGGRL